MPKGKRNNSKRTLKDPLPSTPVPVANDPSPSPASTATVRAATEEDARKLYFPSFEEFPRSNGGTRCIKKILIANNGIAAVKCMRSIRGWAYATFRNSEAFFFVCMATPEDMHANAEYIKIGNMTVMVPGGSNMNNYANVDLILQTAVDNHVDAVWAGWGHASENPHLPEVLAKHNIAFLGPPHAAMWALGDKVASTIFAQSVGIPTVPWSGSDIVIHQQLSKWVPSEHANSEDITPVGSFTSTVRSATSEELHENMSHRASTTVNPSMQRGLWISPKDYAAACVATADACQVVADRIGYPVMIKASDGGGGKGIRRATAPEDIHGMFFQVRHEVPGSPIFVMKCMEHARHLEVQLVADQYGEAISLFSRDCSVQRRHQKILEEAPVVVAPVDILKEMESAAVRLAKLVGYVSAGTVEYLYNLDTKEFFFLELNPRLQVEHPCTEVVSGVNLPACQLQIAMGLPLDRIKDIRTLFGQQPGSDTRIDFTRQLHLRRPPNSHVIAVRITSEDPDEGFKPRSGDVLELNFKSSRSVWGYFSVGTAGGVHEFADSQFGHCFSAEDSREKARENMVLALKELSIRGDFRTTVEYLIKILESETYINNEIDTEWLDKLIAQKDRTEKPDASLGVMCTVLHIAYNELEQIYKNFQMNFERGQFFPTNKLSNCVDVTLVYDSIKYVVTVVQTGLTSFHLITNGSLLTAEVHRMSGDGLLITHETASYMTYCREDAQGYRTVIDNRTVVFHKEFDLSLLRSQSAGKLVQFTVDDGCHVFANEVYALIEVMKLILELRAPTSGYLHHLRCAGAVLEPGAEIGRMELDDPKKLQKLELFKGILVPCGTRNPGDYSSMCESYNSGVFDMDSTDAPSGDMGNRRLIKSEFSDSGESSSSGGAFPPSTTASCGNDRLHHTFLRCLSQLEQVLAGYALPEPFFTPWLEANLDNLFRCLRDPRLPLQEFQETIAQLSSRLPATVEQSLRTLALSYSSQVTSMLANFPADRIIRLLESHIANIRLGGGKPGVIEATISTYQQTVQRLIDVAERYCGGLRGHTVRVISQLLLTYVAVEQHYQHGQFDRCVNILLTRHKELACQKLNSTTTKAQPQKHTSPGGSAAPPTVPKGTTSPGSSEARQASTDLMPPFSIGLSDSVHRLADPRTVADVASVHFSHHQLQAKNALIVGILDRLVSQRDLATTHQLTDSLTALTQLGMAENSKVALAARKLLISAQSPPYELRKNQAECFILAAVNNYGDHFSMESLRKLISSQTAVFDLVMDFMYDKNPLVNSVALEVYIRRAYTSYQLTALQHSQLTSGGRFIIFRFLLPNANILKRALNQRRFSNNFFFDSMKQEANATLFTLHDEDSEEESESATGTNVDAWNADMSVEFSLNDDAKEDERVPKHQRKSGITQITHTSVPANLSNMLTRSSFSSQAYEDSGDFHLAQLPPGSSVAERLGGMFVFRTFADFESAFAELVTTFMDKVIEMDDEICLSAGLDGPTSSKSSPSLASESDVQRLQFPPAVVSFQDPPYNTVTCPDEPVNVLNVTIRRPLLGPVNSTTGQPAPTSTAPTEEESNDEHDVRILENFCLAHADRLRSIGIRRITFVLSYPRRFPSFFTFRSRDNFCEDRVYRHLEPAMAFQMEINRLRNYNLEILPVVNKKMHLYIAQAKVSQGRGAVDYRFFLRSIVRHGDMLSNAATFEYLQSEAERTLLESMDALELAFTHPKANFTTGNHIFMNFASTLVLDDINRLEATVRRTVIRYATRLMKLRVNQAELKMIIHRNRSEPPVPIRLLLSNEQGYNLKIEIYREAPNLVTGTVHFVSFGSRTGSLHGQRCDMPYETKDFLQLKRFQAQKFNSTYVYDYPAIFGQALRDLWNVYKRPESSPRDRKAGITTGVQSTGTICKPDTPRKSSESCRKFSSSQTNRPNVFVLDCKELVLDENSNLKPIDRLPGTNQIAMVVWYLVLKTPEYPDGRPLLVIGNDVTQKAGSFGPAEDLLFLRTSQLARKLAIPLIFLATNSGARIRLADEVKSVYKIAWVDPELPEKGFHYLYLTPEDYTNLRVVNAVNCQPIEVDGETRYKIVDIIGKDFDVSVENLRGSAMIAGETSSAYDECFTISIVSSRTIGIGAYLVRLGQRVIQVENSHIILTGAMALNKLLGGMVYTSNSQLGGVQVMANNGVSHLVVPDEYYAIQHSLRWISYVPWRRGERLPVLRLPVPPSVANWFEVPHRDDQSQLDNRLTASSTFDPIDRLIDYVPTRERPNDDPRWMFTGVMSNQLMGATSSSTDNEQTAAHRSRKSDQWLAGFFDWGTWKETLSSWAAGVLIGRARLGGLPCGIIAPETRLTTAHVPADPANPASEAQTISQAGQVWYPDSSHKTAQAIADFAREDLPLFIFANWRGFSGGLKDMYDQVLKFGSMIVEALHRYPNPVFVYLPPHAELRGGAWVVIDPAINPDRMEMYCTPDTCRAGVLEPEGTVEIKYRRPELLATIDRLDDECRRLVAEIKRLQSETLSPSGPSAAASPATTTADTSQLPADATVSSVPFRPCRLATIIKPLQDSLDSRRQLLLPIYQQVAHRFADLHDTPGRMVSRGVIHGVVEWRSSRCFFFTRLLRRLLELETLQILRKAELAEPSTNVPRYAAASGATGVSEFDEHVDLLSSALAAPAQLKDTSTTSASPAEGTDVTSGSTNSQPTSDKVHPSFKMITESEVASRWLSCLVLHQSTNLRRDSTLLRKWFIEDHINALHGTCATPATDPQLLGQPKLERDFELTLAWEQNDALVARWLARQLSHGKYLELLVALTSTVNINGCWTAPCLLPSADRMPLAPFQDVVLPDKVDGISPLLSRINAVVRKRVISQIRRLLLSNPHCIPDALDCVSRMNADKGTSIAVSDPAEQL